VNEALLIASAIADFGLVLFAFTRKRTWLYACIIINLLLIVTAGQKLIEVWGYATNVGNVMYASVFFAMFLLFEHGAREHIFRALRLGIVSVSAFSALIVMVLHMEAVPDGDAISAAMDIVFSNVPRFAIASLVGFAASTLIAMFLYLSARETPDRMHWWFRLAAVIIVAQLVDSIIFFTIGFWGSVPTRLVLESIVAGYVTKVVLGLFTVPLVHWSYALQSHVRR
jgi:queuosine precursor transporter